MLLRVHSLAVLENPVVAFGVPTRCRLAEMNGRLQEENAHLKQGNERLGRVIDSGDWSRERLTELAQAGKLSVCGLRLQGEACVWLGLGWQNAWRNC
jgi:hypothetical protein